jgi:sec-independent protein translocase protein TatC
LREKRRIVIMVLLVAAMILTPPDVFTQIVMALPLIVLYELCIWLIRFWERKAP